MFTEEELKAMTMSTLSHSLSEIQRDYSIIYDKYHSGNAPREVYFLHDLVDAIQSINTVLYVYNRDGHIHPNYAIEKLNYGKHIFDLAINYFESEANKDE